MTTDCRNPYRYLGPLDPVGDAAVLVERSECVAKLVAGLERGEYWSVSGGRMVGKTTLLRQISDKYPGASVYLDLEVNPPERSSFYRWLAETLATDLDGRKLPCWEDRAWSGAPELLFSDFLAALGDGMSKRPLLLLDEVDSVPELRTFLHVLRKVYTEGHFRTSHRGIAVVLAGDVELLELSVGPTSPFNIADIERLHDFSECEALSLVSKPLEPYDIVLPKTILCELISRAGRHPQILQHACHLLFQVISGRQSKTAHLVDIEHVVTELFATNQVLSTLKAELQLDEILRDLLSRVLRGERVPFLPYSSYAVCGAAPLAAPRRDQASTCEVRSGVFRRYLEAMGDGA